MDGRRSRPLSVTSAAPGTQPGFELGPRQGGWRAQGPARLCPRSVQAPRGRRGQGAAVRSPGSALTPGVPGPGRGCGGGAPDGSSLPTHPLPPCAPVPDLSVFLVHIFLTCCYPPQLSHCSCSFCTPSGSSLVRRAPRAGTRTLGHLLSSDRRVFGFYCLSVPKWENPDTDLL